MIKRQEKSLLPTDYGTFHMYAYSEESSEKMPHIALVHQNYAPGQDVVLRIHSECMTGDVFSSKRCDCGEQLHQSMKIIEKEVGILLYLRQEGRGIGLLNKMKAYNHQDEGMNTIEANETIGFAADERNYKVAIQILKDLSVQQVKLITNNPLKLNAFKDSDIKILDRIPIIIRPNDVNQSYLKTKADKMGHMFSNS